MKRKQFTFYGSFFDAMSDMGMYKRGVAITAICNYALHGIEPPQFDGKMKMFMDLVRPNLEASRKKALAGQLGAGVTNRKKSAKKEIEIEKELEIEIESESKRIDALRECFEKFWNIYPVKIGKEEAWDVWRRKEPKLDAVCEAVALWKNSRQWNQEQTRFVPRAAKFLEQEYYLQKPEVKVPMGATGHLGKAELEALERIMRKE